MTDASPEGTRDTSVGIEPLSLRDGAMRVVYGAYTLWALVLSGGVVLAVVLLLGGDPPDGLDADTLPFLAAATTAWRVLSLGAVAVLMWTAGRSTVAAQSLLLGTLCWGVASWLSPSAEDAPHPLATGVFVIVIWFVPWLLLARDRRRLLSVAPRPSPVALLGGIVLTVVAIAWYVETLDDLGLPGAAGRGFGFDAAGLAVVLAVGGLWGGLRPGGAAWPARAVAVACGYLAVWSLARPDDVGRPSLLLVGGLVVAGALLALGARGRARTH